jgi:hypothetical protein
MVEGEKISKKVSAKQKPRPWESMWGAKNLRPANSERGSFARRLSHIILIASMKIYNPIYCKTRAFIELFKYFLSA